MALLEGNNLFVEYKGALTENYIARSLTTFLECQVFYWISEGKAEVDFVVDIGGIPLPVEVKSGQTTKKKSLQVYVEEYSPPISVRTSLRNIAYDANFLNVPLYAMTELVKLIKQQLE